MNVWGTCLWLLGDEFWRGHRPTRDTQFCETGWYLWPTDVPRIIKVARRGFSEQKIFAFLLAGRDEGSVGTFSVVFLPPKLDNGGIGCRFCSKL